MKPRLPLSPDMHENLGRAIGELLDWQLNGIPEDTVLFLLGHEKWTDVGNISVSMLLNVIDNWRAFVVREGTDA